MRSAGVVALLGALAAPAAADEPPAPDVHLDATASGSADGGADGVELSGGAQARAFLGDPDGEQANLGVVADLGVHRVPWLGARRDLAASPFSAATISFEMGGDWGAEQFPHFRGVVSAGWPMTMWLGRSVQDGVRRTMGGGRALAVRNCWPKGDDGESTCLSWFGGGGSDIHDDTYSYGVVDITMLPVEAVKIGPFRVDARLGGGTVSRARLDDPAAPSQFHVTAITWTVRARYHLDDIVLEWSTQRDPYAATDSTLAFEDRTSLSATGVAGRTQWSATAYVARTRWWTAPDPQQSTADTTGGELALSRQVGPLTISARAAAGRSFYAALDGGLPDTPSLGTRFGIEITGRSGWSIPLPTRPE